MFVLLALTPSAYGLSLMLKKFCTVWTQVDHCETPFWTIIDNSITVMIKSFRTDRSRQTVQTQIRLLLEEQSDQGLHCLLFNMHLFDKMPKGLASFLEFYVDYSKFFLRKYFLGTLR